MSVRYHNEQSERVRELMDNPADAKVVIKAIFDNTRAANSSENTSQESTCNQDKGIEVKTSKGVFVLTQVG
jgi:hypothetical protein